MRKAGAESSIVAKMTNVPGTNRARWARRIRGGEMTCNQPSAPVTLAVCGDPISSRALVLLLQGLHYDARFLPLSSAGDPQLLDGVLVLLLTPTERLSNKYRETLFALLRDEVRAANIAILDLSGYSGETRGAQLVVPYRAVRWPWSTAELERQIEEALATSSGVDQGTR
jgi:hypothetical protein